MWALHVCTSDCPTYSKRKTKGMKRLVSARAFLNNIELWLSGAGLAVILAVPAFFATGTTFWKVAAITAIGVGLLHGMIFWVVRRRQRQIRERSIEEIREMLADVVKNQLSVIDMYLPQEDQALVEMELQGIQESIRAISHQVDTLSEEAIHEWKVKYDGAVREATNLEPAQP